MRLLGHTTRFHHPPEPPLGVVTHPHTHTHTHTLIPTHTHTSTHTYTIIHIHTLSYTYTHTHTHTRNHTHTGLAEKDPLHNDGYQLASLLHGHGRPVHCTCYKGLPHGYLSFTMMHRYAYPTVIEAAQWLQALATGDYRLFPSRSPSSPAAPSSAASSSPL
jgi:hypothetical protein